MQSVIVRADEIASAVVEAGLPTLLRSQPCLSECVKPTEEQGSTTPSTTDVGAQDTADTMSLLSASNLPTFRKNGPQQSVGSLLHPDKCQPCVFYCFKRQGCGRGVECQYCHFEHVSKQALKREAWHERNRQRIERYNQTRMERGSTSSVSPAASTTLPLDHQMAPQWRQQKYVAQQLEKESYGRDQWSGRALMAASTHPRTGHQIAAPQITQQTTASTHRAGHQIAAPQMTQPTIVVQLEKEVGQPEDDGRATLAASSRSSMEAEAEVIADIRGATTPFTAEYPAEDVNLSARLHNAVREAEAEKVRLQSISAEGLWMELRPFMAKLAL